MNNNVEYSDKMGSRSRSAWAIVIGPGDELELFTGESIPGKLAVIGKRYTKNGKWSHYTYRLQLAPGVRFLSGHTGWGTGTFVEGLASATGKPTDRWTEVANALGVTLPTAMEFLRAWRPKAAEKLDQIEADLASLDETSPAGAAVISVSYGAPTRKAREEGYWEWPVRVLDETGKEVGRISPDGEATGEVRVLKRKSTSGHGGGYVSLMLAVPEGCRAEHGPVPGEKTKAEVATEERLAADASEWLAEHGQKAVHVATKEYPYGRNRVLDYAEKHGCPIPPEYSRRAGDMWEFLSEAENLVLSNKK